jgi:hypothetical protein
VTRLSPPSPFFDEGFRWRFLCRRVAGEHPCGVWTRGQRRLRFHNGIPGDPIGAARHIHGSLKSDGTGMIVEPFAHDALEDKLNPVGRLYYAASTPVCVPASPDREVGAALGAQAGEGRLREVAVTGGFRHFRRATETPFDLILEAGP